MTKILFFILCFLFVAFTVSAQVEISGQINDSKTSLSIPAANVVLTDTLGKILLGTIADHSGKFNLKTNLKGRFLLQVSFLGYQTFQRKIGTFKSRDLGVISLTPEVFNLSEVNVQEMQQRAEMKGDTVVMNAGAFKTNQDANTEDLLKKMPGVNVENGLLKVQGEQLQKVLVDGKEFFGDDAGLVLKNLPAEVIDKIQVFDRLSEQAQFTGFDNGNTQKTINIVTKPGKNQGQFGKIYAGYGNDNRYQAGFNVNFFNSKRRISILGLTNNVNIQNFSNEDLSGALASSQNNRQRGGPPGRGGGGGGQTQASNFLVGNQNGITQTHALGVQYSQDFKGKVKLSSSYFFNWSSNLRKNDLSRDYILNTDFKQLYVENSTNTYQNINHRWQANIDITLDSMNSLLWIPKLSLQQNLNDNDFVAQNLLNNNTINQTTNKNAQQSNALNFNQTLLLRHKFKKTGRTISMQYVFGINQRDQNSLLTSDNIFFRSNLQTTSITQRGSNIQPSVNHDMDITYTEPIGKNAQLIFSYLPGLNNNINDRNIQIFDPISGVYNLPDSLLSSNFRTDIQKQSFSAGYRYRTEKITIATSVIAQEQALFGNQSFPIKANIRNFFNVWLPAIFFKYNFSKNDALRIFYRTNNQIPSVRQLQPVIDNSNNLILSTGNASLNQEVNHIIGFRFNKAKPASGQTLSINGSVTLTDGFITNQNFVAPNDTFFLNVFLRQGMQLNVPVNLQGNFRVNSFANYGFPISALKSNINVSSGFNLTRIPGLINGIENLSETRNWLAGLVWGSNISERVDFTISYFANKFWVDNSLRPQLNDNYFTHTFNIKSQIESQGGLGFQLDASQNIFDGLNAQLSQNFWLINAGIYYKFLENRQAEFKLSVFDLFKQNISISRNVSELFVEDIRTNALQQFFMITFTYRLRKFGSAK